MSTLLVIKLVAVVCTILVLLLFFTYCKDSMEHLSYTEKLKTSFTGFIANVGDTFGIGSFATIVALRRLFKIMPDDAKLIGSLNLQATVTALVQALIFLQFVKVDLLTLLVSCGMITLGGLVSGFVAVNVSRDFIRKIMLIAFTITGVILLLSQMGIFVINGTGHGLTGSRLGVFAIFMFITGLLPAFGVGYYSLVQVFIFIVGANPIIAFPIMATASAFQMPATSIPFILKRKVYFKSSLILIVAGTVGVLIAAPLITNINAYYLKWILFVVIFYNVIMLLKPYILKK